MTLIVLTVAVVAGLTSPTTGGTPVIFVERISSAISNAASRAGFSVNGGGQPRP